MLGMNPVVHELLASKSFALSNFIFMMRKNVIYAAGMNIKMLAEIFHRHSATFNMPAREATSPGAIPCHFAPGFGYFPQRKIFRVTSISNDTLAYAFQHILELVARELPVIGKVFNIEVNIAIDFVGNVLCL